MLKKIILFILDTGTYLLGILATITLMCTWIIIEALVEGKEISKKGILTYVIVASLTLIISIYQYKKKKEKEIKL